MIVAKILIAKLHFSNKPSSHPRNSDPIPIAMPSDKPIKI